MQKLQDLRETLAIHWSKAVEWQAKHYNARHQRLDLQPGDRVGLSTKNLRFKGENKKLSPRFIGPSRVLKKIGLQAYQLALPEKLARLHNVFPVTLLEPWKARAHDFQNYMHMPDLEDEDEEWAVEEVRDRRLLDGESHYLVKWETWPSEYNQWVPESDMDNAQGAIKKFLRSRKGKQRLSEEGTNLQ